MLTYQLLAFSRRQLLQPEVVDINDVIADTSHMLQMVIGEDVKLVTSLQRAAGLVKIDRGQVSQIIMNLAVNARDAMPVGGTLTIGTSNFFATPAFAKRHAGLLPGAYVKVAVTDTGTGMSEDTCRHIFEPFFTTKGLGKGTGLGLSTVYGIIKQSGGTIIVKTAMGEGTTFELLLPRIGGKGDPATTPPFIEPLLPFGRETILLVEDEEVVRSLLKDVLEACGYKVIQAVDGAMALDIFKNLTDPIDLLITDVVMPQMSGPELVGHVKELMPNLPILFISGYTDDEVMRNGIEGAGVSFLQKPFTVEKVSRCIRELLEARKEPD
jgi:CheY-like chemotaxis protein